MFLFWTIALIISMVFSRGSFVKRETASKEQKLLGMSFRFSERILSQNSKESATVWLDTVSQRVGEDWLTTGQEQTWSHW